MHEELNTRQSSFGYQHNVNFSDVTKIYPILYETHNTKKNDLSKPVVKTAFFYQDGDVDTQGIRMAIHPNRYRSLEALLSDLTEKMPKLTCGARAIYTPRGKDKVRSLADLENNGHYICSERPIKPRGISSDRVTPVWRTGMSDYRRPLTTYPHPSRLLERRVALENGSPEPAKMAVSSQSVTNSNGNSGSSNSLLRPIVLPPLANRHSPTFNDVSPTRRDTRRLFVRFFGKPYPRKTVLIRRRFVKTMNQVHQELTELFGVPVVKVFTTNGRLVSEYPVRLSLLKMLLWSLINRLCEYGDA
ncbi:Doublecortin [Paragonimus heterotremus]|uniref:Doublecortin n=1 Tax=Paragonimus heterotremus TaxID=100268 RepID=A0A8J4TG56_9TREM|nr:Doublecortin [Paragonimus heterotremus]